jgi:hypothetical protein
MFKRVMSALQVVLWCGFALVGLMLLAFMMWNVITLKDKFGVAAHDGIAVGPFGPNGTLAIVPLGPVNGTMTKPQTGIIMGNDDVHYSLMCEKGTYSVYGALIGITFAVLSGFIIFSVVSSHRTVESTRKLKLQRVIFSILLVSIPVTFCFALIFVMTCIEIAQHRHGNRYELYITQFLCSELVALVSQKKDSGVLILFPHFLIIHVCLFCSKGGTIVPLHQSKSQGVHQKSQRYVNYV